MSDKFNDPAKAKADAENVGDATSVKVDGPGTPSRGAQVILTGEAQTAARGGLSSTLEGNTQAMKAMVADGTVADGSTPDGSTLTGKPAPDVVVTEQAKASGKVPAEEGTTRVEVSDPAEDAAKAQAAKPPPAPEQKKGR